MSTALWLALIGIAGTLVGALVNGALATRAKVNEEMRQLRLTSYPSLWTLTANFSRWPRMTNTYANLEQFHEQFRIWYYDTGGLYLSENGRARYGDVQELMAAQLGAAEGRAMPAQRAGELEGDVYQGLLDACSALRTAMTEDLESRRQRSALHAIALARRHERQKRAAATRLDQARKAKPLEAMKPPEVS